MRPLRIAMLAGFFLLAATAAIQFILERRPAPDLPVLARVPEFEFTDQSSNSFSSDALKGKVWLANFFFTNCQGICPAMSGSISALHKKFKRLKDFHIVSVSVDPQRDTPQRMSDYAGRFSADTRNWHFLNGPKPKVDELMRYGLKLGTAEQPELHTTHLVLIDRSGHIRGYYRGLEEESYRTIEADIFTLLRETESPL